MGLFSRYVYRSKQVYWAMHNATVSNRALVFVLVL